MKNTLAKNAFFNIVYNALNVLFPLISSAYLARVLEPDGIGKVTYAQNIASYFLMLAVLGMPYYGTREIAKVQGDYRLVSKVASELIVINFLSTTLSIAAYLLFVRAVFPTNNLLNLVFCLDIAFNYLNVDWLYKGKEEYAYITLRSIFVKLLSLVLLVLLVKDRQDYVVYAVILCLGTGCNHIFNILNARKHITFSFRNLEVRRHLTPIMLLMVSQIASTLYSKVDITMLGALMMESTVGYYSNAHKVISLVLSVVTAITAVFFPRLSFAYKNDREKFDEYISTGLKVILLLSIPSFIGLALVAEDLVWVMFGSLFAPAARTMQILSVLIPVKGAGDLLCYQAVVSTGNEKALLKSRIVAGLSNVILNAFLIPRYAHDGAALASVISELIVNGIMLRFALTITKPQIGVQFVGSVLLSTVAMALTVLAAKWLIQDRILSLAVSVLLGVLAYIFVLGITQNEALSMFLGKIRNRKHG